MKLLPITFFLLLSFFGFSQATIVWDKTYDFGNKIYFYDIKKTYEGGFIIVGTIDDLDVKSKMFLLKINSNGDTLWSKTYGDISKNSRGHDVIQTQDRGYIIVGKYEFNSYVVKTDSVGNQEWEKIFDASQKGCINELKFIEETSDGGFLAGGKTKYYSTGLGGCKDSDVCVVIKMDSIGNVQWIHKSKEGYWLEYSKEIDASKYLVGGSEKILGSNDQAITLLDSIGNVVWQSGYEGDKIASEFKISGDSVSFCTSNGICSQFELSTGLLLEQTNLLPNMGDGFGKLLVTNDEIVTTEYFYQDDSRTFNKFSKKGELLWSLVLDNWPVVYISNEWPTIVSTNNNSSYVIADNWVSNDRSVYKLKVIKIEESTNGILDNGVSSLSEIKVYPNPFSHKTTIELSQHIFHETLKVEILDALGKVLFVIIPSTPVFNIERLNISQGYYFLSIKTKSNKIQKTIVINP